MPSPSREPPYPFDFTLSGEGYLRPPDSVLATLGAPWYTRRSIPWFPDRSQGGAISEALFPPESESTKTQRDFTGGFGWSEANADPGDEITTYAYTSSVDADGQGVDCSVEGSIMLGPLINDVSVSASAACSGHFELTVGGTRYLHVVFGTKMFRSSNGTTFAAVQANGSDLPAVLTGRPVVFQGAQAAPQVYFPHGASTVFSVWDGDSTHAMGTPAVATYGNNEKVIDFMVKDDACWAIWKDSTAATAAYRANKFYDGIPYTSAGASEPNWTASIAVSDLTDPAQYLMLADNRLYVGCNQSLRTLADDDNDLKETLWKTQPSIDNFKWWNEWNGELWFTANQGTYRVLPAERPTLNNVGPEGLPMNRTPVRGVIRAKAGDDYCMYAFLRTEAGVTYLMKYRYYDGGRRAAWHVISKLGTFDVDYAFVSTVSGQSYLYFGKSSTVLSYIILPRNGFYPLSDSTYKFCDKGYLYLTRTYGGMTFVSKTLMAWTGRCGLLTSTENVVAYYRTTEGGSWTQVGATTLASDPGARIGLATAVNCAWWETRITLSRGGTNTLSPLLHASTWSYALRPVAKGQFVIYAWIADYTKALGSLRDRRSAANLETALIGLDSGTTPVTMRNKRGNAYDVLVNQVDVIHLSGQHAEDGHAISAVAKITMTEWAARGAGTHAALGGYTHGYLGGFTHGGLSTLL